MTDEHFLVDRPVREVAPDYPGVSWQEVGLELASALEPQNVEEVEARPDEVQTATEEEWRELVRDLLQRHFASPPEAAAWARRRAVAMGLEDQEERAVALAAERWLRALERVSSPEERAGSRLSAALRPTEGSGSCWVAAFMTGPPRRGCQGVQCAGRAWRPLSEVTRPLAAKPPWLTSGQQSSGLSSVFAERSHFGHRGCADQHDYRSPSSRTVGRGDPTP